MSPEERRIANAIFTWLEVRQRAGFPLPERVNAARLLDEAEKSGLLGRLMSGQEALPEAPPLSFGSPWYDIVEKGRANGVLVEDVPGNLRRQCPNHVLVNRFPWLVLEPLDDEGGYLVTWRPGGPPFWLAPGALHDCNDWSLVRIQDDPAAVAVPADLMDALAGGLVPI
ncbi:MAG: hypothetical protein ACM31L_09620 [Actinomycetota bacterium]